ncbi:MAG: hypothetical protein U5K00_21110 [Melioribacteraceae bacterium]|nr:hypothetical protein [Melioribacteraceae bacterium]
MKNKNEILKYLSDLMSESEKEIFERRLATDTELRSEFDLLKLKLSSLKETAEIEPDSSYFNNLLPRSLEKIDARSKKRSNYLIPAFSFGITILLIFLLNLPSLDEKSSQNNFGDIDFAQLIEESDSEELLSLFESNFINDYVFYRSGSYTEFIDLENEDEFYLLSEGSLENFYYEAEAEYNPFSTITDEEAEIIYEELINKKIL